MADQLAALEARVAQLEAAACTCASCRDRVSNAANATRAARWRAIRALPAATERVAGAAALSAVDRTAFFSALDAPTAFAFVDGASPTEVAWVLPQLASTIATYVEVELAPAVPRVAVKAPRGGLAVGEVAVHDEDTAETLAAAGVEVKRDQWGKPRCLPGESFVAGSGTVYEERAWSARLAVTPALRAMLDCGDLVVEALDDAASRAMTRRERSRSVVP